MKLFKALKKGISIALIASFAITSTSYAETKPVKEIRIGNFPNITHSQALVGKANGAFQKAFGSGTKVTWHSFNAGPAEVEAIFSKQIDIAYIGPGPAVNAFIKSKGAIKIIAGATDAGAILVSRKDVKIKSIKELSGKKVAVPQFGNTQDLALRGILKSNGLKDTTKGGTVEIIQAENADIKTLIDRKQIDFALVPEPWGSRLISESGANVVLDYNKIWKGKYPSAVVIARTDFIKKNPELVDKFIKTHVELTGYINKNKETAKSAVNGQIKNITGKALKKEVLDSAFKRLTVTNKISQSAISEIANIAYEVGFSKTKPNLNGIYELKFLNKYAK